MCIYAYVLIIYKINRLFLFAYFDKFSLFDVHILNRHGFEIICVGQLPTLINDTVFLYFQPKKTIYFVYNKFSNKVDVRLLTKQHYDKIIIYKI